MVRTPGHTREALSLGPTYYKDFTHRCLENVENSGDGKIRSLIDEVRAYADSTPSWRWGSGCSGTDAPAFAFTGIFEGLRRWGTHDARMSCGHAHAMCHIC